MSFLNPAMLFGLTALAIPIIVHLLNRRRFKKVKWAAMRFLQVSLERNQRRMKIEDLILLLLRLAIVALLALALSRPAADWLKSQALGSKVASSILIDSSGSMLRKDASAEETRFEIARKVAGLAFESLPRGSATALIFGANSPGTGIKEPTHDLERAKEQLKNAEPTHRGSDLFPAIRSALASLEGRSSSQKELVIITDGDATAWRQFESITRALERSKDDIRTVIALVGKKPGENLSITRLAQNTPVAAVGQPVRLAIEVTNFGFIEAEDVEIQLRIGNESTGEAVQIELIPPGESRTITAFVELSSPGFQRISATLPVEDASTVDNDREIVIRGIEKERALLVDGQPGRNPTEEETFFLQNALVPVQPELVESFFLGADRITVGELPTTVLEEYRAIFLANVAELSDEASRTITEFVRDGGGLVVFPGSNINTSFYNTKLHEELNLLPASFGEIIPEEGSNKTLMIQASGYDHPLVELWNDPGAGTLADAEILKAFTLNVHTETDRNQGKIVLRYSNGSAAVVESDFGLGKVYQFSSTADTEWNNLPVKPAFLPIVHRVFGSILGRRDAGLNITVGDSFIRRGPAAWAETEATISYSDAATGSKITIASDDDGAKVQYDKVNHSGAYELEINEPFEVLQFSASADPQESNPETLSDAQKKRLKEVSAEFVEILDTKEISNALTRKRKGAELWPIFLLAAGLIAILELFLSQKFSQEK